MSVGEVSLFVRATEDINTFVKQMQELTSLPLHLNTKREKFGLNPIRFPYVFTDKHADHWFAIGEHDLENDGSLKFEEYNYRITIGGKEIDYQRRLDTAIEAGRQLFDQLKVLDRYRLLMIKENFHPGLYEIFNPEYFKKE